MKSQKAFVNYLAKKGYKAEIKDGKVSASGWLDLSGTSITSLPDNLTVGGSLDLSGTSITSLPDNLTVGGWLDLSGTSITSLPDNLTVGGSLYLSGTALENKKVNYRRLTDNQITDKWIYADGVLRKYKHAKKLGDFTVYDCYFQYVVSHNGNYAHAKTIKQAILDIRFKEAKRNADQYKSLKKTDKLSYDESIIMYRVITGACSGGTNQFLSSQVLDEKKQYTISEIIEKTKGQYGNERLAEFFK